MTTATDDHCDTHDDGPTTSSSLQNEKKDKIDAIWKSLNSNDPGVTAKATAVIQGAIHGKSSDRKKKAESHTKRKKHVPEWMISLGISPKPQEPSKDKENGCKEISNNDAEKEAVRKAAAAALAAAKATSGGLKDEKINMESSGDKLKDLKEGAHEIEAVKRKAEMQSSSSKGLDALLEKIGKKPKGNILDRSRKDWGEFKEEKGITEELEAYKKSGEKYLDRVAFLQRAEYREYEKERDARQALHAKKKPDGSLMESED